MNLYSISFYVRAIYHRLHVRGSSPDQAVQGLKQLYRGRKVEIIEVK